MKNVLKYAIVFCGLLGGMTACVQDLKVESIDPNNVSAINPDQLLGKIYATLGTTGQKGPDGNGDIEGLDEGTSSLFRMTHELNEFPSDGVYWIWPDVGVDDVNKATWTASNSLVRGAYSRYIFDITLCNTYLENYSDIDDAKTAEVRFIRALNYWYLLDMFGNCPFNITPQEMASYEGKSALKGEHEDYPKMILRKDLYAWLEKELLDIEPLLTVDRKAFYYRVDSNAAKMLLARLYLNAAVYTADPKQYYNPATGEPQWQKAADYAKQVIDNTQLASQYKYLFMGDNDNLSSVNDAYKEIILPVAQDGAHIRSWGGSLYLIAATHSAEMPSWNITESWKCIRAKKQLVELFFPLIQNWKMPVEDVAQWKVSNETAMAGLATCPNPKGTAAELTALAGDDRAMFCSYRMYTDTTFMICNINKENTADKFFSGWLIEKFTNNMADPAHKPGDSAHPDMDIPLMRAAEAYLTYAEAQYRLGNTAAALDYANKVRARAHATDLTTIDEKTLSDEWQREFYCEGRRRTDLVRLGLFTGNAYGWEWKAGNQFGQKGIDEYRSVFPLPTTDVVANPNLEQYCSQY